MLPMILSMFLAGLSGDGPASNEAQLVVDTIEALQQPVEDFRCEFEGTRRHKGKGTEKQKLGEDGLADSFSGTFTWRRGGDFRCDSLHRSWSDNGMIVRQTVIVRLQEDRAEQYRRFNDSPTGQSIISSARGGILNIKGLRSPRDIFLIDDLKYDVTNQAHVASVHDDRIDGPPLKVLDIGFKGVNQLFRRYWIDLQRNGHVVRDEIYLKGEKLLGRRDIKLTPFKVVDKEVWMPVSADHVSFASGDPKEPISSEPTVLETMYIVDGTIEFNKHPGPEVFTIKHKPGTPISDKLRKLTYEFGQQKISLKPTKAETEKMLKEQLLQAEQQKSELVVASVSEGFAWSTILAWGFGALVVISLITLWVQRRGY